MGESKEIKHYIWKQAGNGIIHVELNYKNCTIRAFRKDGTLLMEWKNISKLQMDLISKNFMEVIAHEQ